MYLDTLMTPAYTHRHTYSEYSSILTCTLHTLSYSHTSTYSHSLTRSYTGAHPQILACSYLLTHLLKLACGQILSHTLKHVLTLTHPLTNAKKVTCSHTHALPASYTGTCSESNTGTCSLTHTQIGTYNSMVRLMCVCTQHIQAHDTLTCRNTHMHTPAYILTHTYSHTHWYTLAFSYLHNDTHIHVPTPKHMLTLHTSIYTITLMNTST